VRSRRRDRPGAIPTGPLYGRPVETPHGGIPPKEAAETGGSSSLLKDGRAQTRAESPVRNARLALTNRLLAPAFATLDDAGEAALLAGLSGMRAAI